MPVISDREFHDIETSSYWLPKDDEEQMRLTGVRTKRIRIQGKYLLLYSNILLLKKCLKGNIW
jgi:hypothetical protein